MNFCNLYKQSIIIEQLIWKLELNWTDIIYSYYYYDTDDFYFVVY